VIDAPATDEASPITPIFKGGPSARAGCKPAPLNASAAAAAQERPEYHFADGERLDCFIW
jgi:hypothetical protein